MKTKEEIIEINKQQKEFYNTKKRNFVTEAWSKFRGLVLGGIRKDLGISTQIYDLHKDWLGDLSDKKVLDLGCYSGNYLSLYIAENSKEYIGIDLSDVAIDKLNQKLKDLPHAKALAVDFLSEEDFSEKDFDVIYAYGVLHHFQNTKLLIDKLKDKLSPNGILISYDPLETSLPVKIVRALYRPFQSDAEWEWPFTKKTYYKYKSEFNIIDKRAVLGKSKYAMLINFIPLGSSYKNKLIKKWHDTDWEKSQSSDEYIFGCMHLTMKMENVLTAEPSNFFIK